MAADPVRDEAERLVAAAIAAASLAVRGLAGAAGRGSLVGSLRRPVGGFATGSQECCVCPVCRVIAAMRDPSADLAERMATGAGDLATGVTGLLRALGRPGRDMPPPSSYADDAYDPWGAATAPTPAPAPAPEAKPMAKKAVKKAAPKAATAAASKTATRAATGAPGAPPEPVPPEPVPPAPMKAAKKAPTKAPKKAPTKAGKQATKKATKKAAPPVAGPERAIQ